MAITIEGRSAAARLLCAAILLPALAVACRTDASSRIETGELPSAECPVCKAEGDLACLHVKIRPDTPRSVYQGTEYFFCSEQCKAEFERRPRKYLGNG